MGIRAFEPPEVRSDSGATGVMRAPSDSALSSDLLLPMNDVVLKVGPRKYSGADSGSKSTATLMQLHLALAQSLPEPEHHLELYSSLLSLGRRERGLRYLVESSRS